MKKKEIKNLKVSICLNILIAVFTIVASIIMFTGFEFMHGRAAILETTKIGMFKFYTVDSNIFMGLVALIFLLEEIKALKGNTKEIKPIFYILKLAGTIGVTLTFLVVFGYLGIIAEGGIFSLLMNSNLFFHLIIPVLSIISFIFFEKTNKIKFKHTFFSLIPTCFYMIFYTTNIIIHMENYKVSPIYDWYWFVQNGVQTAFIVEPVMFLITYTISLALYKLNKTK